jgi:hypothetical protein
VQLAPFVSKTVPLADWKSGLDAVLAKTAYKVLLKPDNNFA